MSPVVISLCDLTGQFVAPWVTPATTRSSCDRQHGVTSRGRSRTQARHDASRPCPSSARSYVPRHVAARRRLAALHRHGRLVARDGSRPSAADPMFQAKAVAVAEQCRTIGRLSGAPWLVENPVSVLPRRVRQGDHSFHPADFTAFEPADNYTKKTCLWTGGGFIMPPVQRDTLPRATGQPHPHRQPRDPSAPTSEARHRWGSRGPCSRPTGADRGGRMTDQRRTRNFTCSRPEQRHDQTAFEAVARHAWPATGSVARPLVTRSAASVRGHRSGTRPRWRLQAALRAAKGSSQPTV